MPRVLIVDADAALARSVSDLFARRGIEAVAAASAEEALHLLGGGAVDLLLTELQLPGMGGFDLVRAARAIVPALPFVVLTGAESFSQLLQATRLGAKNYFVKHVDRVDFLVESVEATLIEARVERERRDLLALVSTLHEEFLRSLVHLERENAELQAKLGGGTSPTNDYRILVVDDEPLVCMVLQEAFRDAGMRVDVAYNGEQAFQTIAAGGLDLVITDKNLPGITGLELLRRVKERDPNIEVLLMTGYASLDSAIEAIDAGAAGYVLKPFEDLQEVVGRVREIRRKQEFRTRAAQFLERFKARNREFIERYQELRRRLAELNAQEARTAG